VTGADETEKDGAHDITIVQFFDAPRELVFRHWVDPTDVGTWFAPDNCTVTSCELDARPGGNWRVAYTCDPQGAYVEYGEFHEVTAPERLVFSLTQEDAKGHAGPKTLITVTFAEAGTKTRMTFNQTGFDTASRADNNAEGWKECFRKLEAQMAKQA
jgi:uncharacterized protein YndB with AHSA1/START domain